jgi:hypothetical protein
MKAHRLDQYYKPLKGFGTFDFETVETHVNEKVGKSEILSVLTTLSVSSAFSCPLLEGKSIFYDKRDGENWVHKWLANLFSKAKIIAEYNEYTSNDFDNLVSKLTIEHINDIIKWEEVPIIGFNSARFDMNLFLNELNCEEWHILPHDCMISERNMRMIKVIHNKTGIVLAFKDIKHFIAVVTLASFGQDYGNGMIKSFLPYEAFDSETFME